MMPPCSASELSVRRTTPRRMIIGPTATWLDTRADNWGNLVLGGPTTAPPHPHTGSVVGRSPYAWLRGLALRYKRGYYLQTDNRQERTNAECITCEPARTPNPLERCHVPRVPGSALAEGEDVRGGCAVALTPAAWYLMKYHQRSVRGGPRFGEGGSPHIKTGIVCTPEPMPDYTPHPSNGRRDTPDARVMRYFSRNKIETT